MRPEDTEMIANICSFERMEAAITEFQPFKALGPDGLYPVLLQKGWNQLKGYYHVIFQACLRHSYVPLAWKEGTGIFFPKPGKESYFEAKSFRMITLTSFMYDHSMSTVKVYTDGSKLNGRVGAGFYAEYPNNSPKQAYFHLGIYSTVFQAEVLAILEVAKNLLLDKMHNQRIVVLDDSQAAIKALIKCTVTSITVLNCIRNLNQLGKQNHVSIAWIPGHAGIHGNKVADYVAKSGSRSKIHGPEPFITVPYASCVSTVKD